MPEVKEYFDPTVEKRPAFVVYDDLTDKNGDPVPIVSMDYDLSNRDVTWTRNWLPPQADDVRWERTNWDGASEALHAKKAHTHEVDTVRAKYIAEFKILAAQGKIDAEHVAKL